MAHAINTETPPAGMNRQVNRLTAFIKPASPTEEFRNQVAANTKTWMQNNLALLKNHYTEIIVLHTDIRSTQTALTVAKGWAKKRYGPRLHPETFDILSAITFDTGNANSTNASEPHRDAAAADVVTRTSTEDQFDVRDERQFPKLSRNIIPPTRSLYMGSRRTLTEQYPQIHIKATPLSNTAPKPEPPNDRDTHRSPNFSTSLLPKRTGPIKGSRTGANCPLIHGPNSIPTDSEPVTPPGVNERETDARPAVITASPLSSSPPSVLCSTHNCSHISDPFYYFPPSCLIAERSPATNRTLTVSRNHGK